MSKLFSFHSPCTIFAKDMKQKEENREDVRRIGWVVLVLATMLTLPFIGMGHFYTRGEPREALVAMAMLDQGNFILPFFQGEFAFKPPMLHWLVALFSMPQGYVSEMTARLPSALAYIAMCYGFFVFFSRRYHVGKVLIATMVLITSFEVHRAAMTCRVDMVLTAFMVGGFLFLYRWKERGYRGMPWLASLMISGAILTKGPIGAILPCAVMAVMMIVDGEKTKPVLKALLKVALLSSVLPLCWYAAAYHVGGDRFLDLMMEENFGRFLGKMSYESHENGPFYYFPILLSGLLPWSLLIVGSLFAVRWREVGMTKFKAVWSRFRSMDSVMQFAVVASVLIFVFYEIPKSKRSVYLLPMYPFLSLAIANLIVWLLQEHRRIFKAYAVTIVVVGVVFSVALIALHAVDLSFLGDSRSSRRLALQLGELQKMPMGVAYVLASLMPVLVAVAIWMRRKALNLYLWLAVGVWVACYMSLDGVLNPALKNCVPDYYFAQKVKVYQPDGRIGFYRVGKEEPAYAAVFYLDDKVMPYSEVSAMPETGYVMLREANKERFEEEMSAYRCREVARTDNEFTSFKGNLLLYKYDKR